MITVALWDKKYRGLIVWKTVLKIRLKSSFSMKYKTNLRDLPNFDIWNIPYNISKNCIRFSFKSWWRQIEYWYLDYFPPYLLLNIKKVFNFQHNILQGEGGKITMFTYSLNLIFFLIQSYICNQNTEGYSCTEA